MELYNELHTQPSESEITTSLDFEEDEIHDECGVFGIYAPELQDVARTISLALIALQHRGQESCGIVTSKGDKLYSYKGIGLVSQVFNNEDVFKPLKGGIGIGHNRYSTSGKNTMDNVQPVTVQTYHGDISIAQNGNLSTQRTLKKKLMREGVGMFRESDCEVIAQMLSSNSFLPSYKVEDGPLWEKRIQQFMHESDGAYSLVIMVKDAIYACRDHLGMRPLCIGSIICKNPATGEAVERFLVSSESCALIMAAQAKYIREVLPGEIIRLDKDGLHTIQGRAPNPAFCIFEYVYFARPDSLIEGQLVVKARERMGKELAKEYPCKEGELVVGVPDSSLAAAIGYSQQSGIPYAEGIMKNRYVHRTFIQPTQRLRQLGVSMKFTPIEERLKGKKIVLIDDSIVRGNTIANLIKMLRSAGAEQIHVRIASPPVVSPCFMGIDLSTTEHMVAYNRTIEEVKKEIGADSLQYLTVEGMEKATKEGLKDPDKAGYCRACFTGVYPLKVDDW